MPGRAVKLQSRIPSPSLRILRGQGVERILAPSAQQVNAAVNGHAAAKTWLRALELTAPIVSEPACILPTAIEDIAKDYGEAPALLSEREQFTQRALVERSNK